MVNKKDKDLRIKQFSATCLEFAPRSQSFAYGALPQLAQSVRYPDLQLRCVVRPQIRCLSPSRVPTPFSPLTKQFTGLFCSAECCLIRHSQTLSKKRTFSQFFLGRVLTFLIANFCSDILLNVCLQTS